MTMKTEERVNHMLSRWAAEWLERVKSGDRRTHRAFVSWLRQSRLHLDRYLEAEAIDRQVQALDAADRPDIDGLIRDARNNVVALEELRPIEVPRTPATGQRWWTVAAGLIGLIIVLGWTGYLQPARSRNVVATEVGEQRILTLPDGSLARVNVDTALQIRFTENERAIEMSSGEAVFEVAHDAGRPFTVRTPTAHILALGTQFNVYQRNATVVSVLEGRVQVTTPASQAPQALAAGEEAEITDGRIEKRAHPDVAKAVAWREGRLYFDDMPVEEIVSEFNRHGGPIRIRLEGVPANTYRFGGTFRASDPTSFSYVLQQQPELIVERRQREIVVRPAHAPP